MDIDSLPNISLGVKPRHIASLADPSILRETLAETGVISLDLYAPETIQRWNDVLNPLFEERANTKRSYVVANELHDLGIFAEQFTPGLLSVFEMAQEHPVLYHCHVYEIQGEQALPHDGARNLNGWHRDIETVGVFPSDPLAFLSIFTLLSDVGAGDGGFEFVPRLPERVPANGEACVQMTGQSGRSLLWNRSFFHRASPNNGPRRRRILKVSVQPARLPNDRLGLNEFRAIDGLNPDLRSLLGAGFHSGGDGAAVAFEVPQTTGTVQLSAAGRVTYRVVQAARSRH